MNSTLTSCILLAILVATVLLGRRVRRPLPNDHLNADSRDAVKLAKGTYDTQRDAVIQMASRITFIHRALTADGPEAVSARAEEGLAPRDDIQRSLKTQAASAVADLAQLRYLILAQAVSSIPKPLPVMVGAWLVIIFLCFSLLAPPNATTDLALFSAAISVAGAVFLIMKFDQPLGGMIRISSAPMAHALNQLAP